MNPLRLAPCLLLALLPSLAHSGAAAGEGAVPKGEVLKFSFERSRVFPGTYRDYWVYVPAQYTPDKPACVYVNQDGVQWNAPAVFDRLIAAKEMPVTIGVFVMHGRVRAADGNAALDRFNRSYEYDGLGDSYARFLIEELLPDVETKKASDGRALRISRSGNDHAIGGASSGAVCAFTAAWERPDQFSRVFSAIGTYVGLRGADRYPTLIRKYEPKPIRVFLQDGSADLNIYGGDWWMANQMLERALTFSGYEVRHVWGEGGHNGQQGTQLFPDAMRWLWKDWPQPVKAGPSKNQMLNEVLAPGEGWQPAGKSVRSAGGLVALRKGEVILSDAKKAVGQALGPDGRVYAVTADGKVVASDPAGKTATLAGGIRGSDLVVSSGGSVYVAEPGPAGGRGSKVWLVRPGEQKKGVADTGLLGASGVTLSPDQTLLYVADGRSHWVHSFRIRPDGTLEAGQQYYWLHVPDDTDASGAGGMCVDRDGRLYVATSLGVQVCDQAGRVNCILPVPGGPVSSVCFGGAARDTLYALSGGRIYSRKLAAKGRQAWDPPNKPAPPRL